VYLEASESETSIVCIDEKSKLYILDEEADSFDEGEVKKFVSKFKAGKLKPYIKSEPVPKKNKKAVKIAVGKTIDSILDTPDQEIVIAFVAQERFGDLEAFEVNYEKVASELASKKNVVFYKINAFKNDFPDMFKPSLRQPSVYYIGSNAKANPVLCESSDKDWYSVASLKKFVVDNLKYTERTKKEKNNEL
jgi:protein disulfide-isomerase A4